MLLPSGIMDYYAIEAGSLMKVRTQVVAPSQDDLQYQYVRAEARGLATKIPGFFFSGRNTVLLNLQSLVSMDAYQAFIDDIYASCDDCESYFLEKTSTYQFFDNIPKQSLYVRLSPDITDQQRTFVANGIRNYFQGQTTAMLVKHDVVQSFTAVTKIFNLFTAIIAAISLFIAFFLLLISMT